MTNLACSYHPSQAPSWACKKCDRHFCDNCVVNIATNVGTTTLPQCTLCDNELSLSANGQTDSKSLWGTARGLFSKTPSEPEQPVIAFAPNTAENVRRQIIGTAHILKKEDRAPEALANMLSADAQLHKDPLFTEQLFALIVAQRHTEQLAPIAERYIGYLLSKDATKEALEVWRQAIRVDVEFLPTKAGWRHTLGAYAHKAQMLTEARTLLVNLHKQDPHYAALEDAYTILASVFADQGASDNAAKVKEFLQQLSEQRSAAKNQEQEPPAAKIVDKNASPDSWALVD